MRQGRPLYRAAHCIERRTVEIDGLLVDNDEGYYLLWDGSKGPPLSGEAACGDERREAEARHRHERKAVVIKWNREALSAPCGICASPTEGLIGAGLFVDGTDQAVCLFCGEKQAPQLYRILVLLIQAEIYLIGLYGANGGMLRDEDS